MSVPSPGSNPLLLTHPLLQHHRQRLPFDLNRRVSRRWFHRLSPSQTEEQNLRLRHHHPPPLRQVSSTSTTLLILYFAPYTTSSISNRWILSQTRDRYSPPRSHHRRQETTMGGPLQPPPPRTAAAGGESDRKIKKISYHSPRTLRLGAHLQLHHRPVQLRRETQIQRPNALQHKL